MISHKEDAVQRSNSLIGVTQQEYYRLPTEASESDQQDLSKNKFITATTFSVDLRKFNVK
jgi:hypothetical protein